MASALAFAEHIVSDLKRLELAAWVFRQAVESISARNGQGGSNCGLVKAGLRAPATGPHAIHVTRKYWAMAQFSRYVRPGYWLVPVGDMDTVGALSPDGCTLVMVRVNGGFSSRRMTVPVRYLIGRGLDLVDRVVQLVAPGAVTLLVFSGGLVLLVVGALPGAEGRLAPLWAKLGRAILQNGERVYGFAGLRAFKAKFQPRWAPRYIPTPRWLGMAHALIDLAKLVSG